MGRYGDIKLKRDVEYLLQTGYLYVKDLLRDEISNTDEAEKEIDSLREILYSDGQIMSEAKKVAFERKINNLERKIEKKK